MLPSKIGRYEIKSELGRGGMATVYRAYDPSFDREVAIKVLPREFLHDPQFRDRFQREIKTIAALEHPAIVPVYDVGEDDGLPYFVMRYMTGGSLTDLIKKKRFSLEDTAQIIERIAQALAYAHKKGVIHRDLKPDNILFDNNDNPFISDFGIAKFSEAASSLTGSGIIGTPAYMSPEQAQGNPVDSRSDIYGLGVIVYQMLSGKQPYNADTPMGVVVKHITEPVPEILKVTPDLPEAADTIIKVAMAKDRQNRYATATDLAKALNVAAFGAEKSAAGAVSSKTIEPKKSPGKLRGIIAAVIVVVAMAGIFLLWNQLFVPAKIATPKPTSILASPESPTLIPFTPTASFAPLCRSQLIPTPLVKETNKICSSKMPYTTLSIPKGSTFESLEKGFTCVKERDMGNEILISCTGKALYSFNLRVCAARPVFTPVSSADVGKCEQGANFDSAGRCCVPAFAPDDGCLIFKVDLRGCGG